MQPPLSFILAKYQQQFGQVVPLANDEHLLALNLSSSNPALVPATFQNTESFSHFIDETLANAGARYGIGGYLENRDVYSRSQLFDGEGSNAEARTIHLGIDIWGKAGTPVYAPLGGTVHSFAFNNHFGDYGATIILQHQLDGISFHTLYGHLSLADLRLGENQFINVGEVIGHFGEPHENGHWPPHLHFQVISDMQLKQGDYPGVCRPSEKSFYAANCPDPEWILNLASRTKTA